MFRLNRLQLFSHPILKNIDIDFTLSGSDSDTFATTVLIGLNGTGKSNILRAISEIFRALDVAQNEKSKPNIGFSFNICYSIGGTTYLINRTIHSGRTQRSDDGGVYMYFKNPPNDLNITFENLLEYKDYGIKLHDLILPERTLASSLILTDKFNSRSTAKYKYIGVRSETSPSTSGTKTYIRKTVANILDGVRNKGFAEELKRLFELMEFEQKLEITYTLKYRNQILEQPLSEERLDDIFIHKWTEIFPKRNSQIWGAGYYKTLRKNDGLLNRICSFVNENRDGLKSSPTLKYNILTDSELADSFEVILELGKLDLLSFPSITISKQANSFELINSSSGETNLITSMIAILSQIRESSLVLIDEPEISLHPNWQIQYLDFLQKIFSAYPTCHFVIATHSHFLLSDVDNKNSSAILIKKDVNDTSAEKIEYSTLGWSPENILYSAFNVVSTRNYYFESDVHEALRLISQGSNEKDKLEGILTKIKKVAVSLEKIDPLKEIIDDIEAYINEIC